VLKFNSISANFEPRGLQMKRREFIAALGGAVAWPVVARAQPSEPVRRVGVLMAFGDDDLEGRAFLAAFRRGLRELGRPEGSNLHIHVRWTAGSLERMRTSAKELVDLQPDVILSHTTPVTAALERETRTIPIVFVTVSDRVGSGFAASLPRPDGNITGFSNYDSSMVGKWLELLTQIAPGIKRTSMMFNPDMSPYVGSYYLPFFQVGARSLKVEPISAPVRSEAEIEAVISSVGREPGGSIIVMPDVFLFVYRAPIISAAIRNNVPSVFNYSAFVKDGGLLSYGPDTEDVFHRAASYVDRILRGAKPAELPVQLPVKFEMALNIKTAKTLGLEVPPSILLSADEVIE
jgi:putative tryptophan/tyrosine transport system substrate-binding protein